MKGIIFDLDGVLVFTDKLHYQAWKQVAKDLGVYFDEKINNRLRGVSRKESLEIILENYNGNLSDDDKNKLLEKKNSIYINLLRNMVPEDVCDEVRETLQKLHDSGYKLAVGSSSKNAVLILKQVDLYRYFDAISDGTNITKSKPNPEVFIKAAEFLEVEPCDCIVVEDAYVGIDAAISAGMLGIGIGDASHYEKADFRIKSFIQIEELLNDIM